VEDAGSGSGGRPPTTDWPIASIWLTPLLHEPELAAQYEHATAPVLFIGGTGDQMWDGDIARRISPHTLEIPEADHVMFVPGSLRESGRAHGEVGAAIERFLDEVVWPS
jgi:hypothetical protein